MTVYHLTLLHAEPTCTGYQERFHIGVFPSAPEAERTAKGYLSTVPGFRDFPCSYTIAAREMRGGPVAAQTVYWIQGWNWNENMGEVDIVESDAYASRADAETALGEMKARFARSAWALHRSVIGQCDWQEGFERADG